MVKTIAIDGMGGDNAPGAVFKGLSQFHQFGFHSIIFGDSEILKEHVKLLPRGFSYEMRHADVIIRPDMDVISGLRFGKNSSMGLAIRAVESGEADAVVSSGNTGLYMALAKIILKTISGIDRPAIASVLPGADGQTVCLDLGANSECSVKNLVDFAIMGEALGKIIFQKKDVKLALLNIGTEDTKGSRLIKKTAEVLKKFFDNYVGFVEGTDICKGNIDVIVTDGFTGNVALKTIEGTAKFITSELKKSFSHSFISKLCAIFAMLLLKDFKKKMDPRRYNGAILLGLNGIVVKSHGNSDGIGFANAIRFTIDILRENIFDRIRDQLGKSEISRISEYCEDK
ncbi:MAG: phosphate acyltransferase PlsX [Holosporaceae bacterium]|nr:phosphate acyltransferase PlsX [Holosporaceae bacterium]